MEIAQTITNVRKVEMYESKLVIHLLVRLGNSIVYQTVVLCFSKRYMFDVLSAGVSVLEEDFIIFISFESFFWKSLLTLRNFICLTTHISSSSKGMSPFTCFRQESDFSPYFSGQPMEEHGKRNKLVQMC